MMYRLLKDWPGHPAGTILNADPIRGYRSVDGLLWLEADAVESDPENFERVE